MRLDTAPKFGIKFWPLVGYLEARGLRSQGQDAFVAVLRLVTSLVFLFLLALSMQNALPDDAEMKSLPMPGTAEFAEQLTAECTWKRLLQRAPGLKEKFSYVVSLAPAVRRECERLSRLCSELGFGSNGWARSVSDAILKVILNLFGIPDEL